MWAEKLCTPPIHIAYPAGEPKARRHDRILGGVQAVWTRLEVKRTLTRAVQSQLRVALAGQRWHPAPASRRFGQPPESVTWGVGAMRAVVLARFSPLSHQPHGLLDLLPRRGWIQPLTPFSCDGLGVSISFSAGLCFQIGRAHV